MEQNHIDLILANVGQEELLAQLAEEATELAHAALKLRRAYSGQNPTPVSSQKAFENLLEEIADIYVCIHVLGLDWGVNQTRISRTMFSKIERWADRLKNT